jgi:hypothetical protein
MAAAGPGGGTDGAEAAAFADAYARLRRDGSIQFDFPGAEPPAPPPDWLQALLRFFGENAQVVTVLFWVLVAVVGAALLFLMLRNFGFADLLRRGQPAGPAAEADAPAVVAARRALLAEAEEAAARGDYDQAVHLLLHLSAEDLQRRWPGAVGPALTAREIAALGAIPPAPRAAFATIAAHVERSLFAARPLGAAEWAACRKALPPAALLEGGAW